MALEPRGFHHGLVELASRWRRRMGVARIAGVVVVLVMASGCSSTHRVAQVCPSPNAAVPVTDVMPSASNGPASAFGRRTLDEAVVPSRAALFTGLAPPGLQCPFLQGPDIGNLVYAHRLWTINVAPHTLWKWLEAHVPNGFVSDGHGTLGGRVVIWYVEDHADELPANISEALLQLSIVGPGSGPAVLRIDSTVGWTAPRPADAFVPTNDPTVIVTAVHMPVGTSSTGTAGTAGKRVTTSDPHLVQPIVRAFDGLRVAPPPGRLSMGCEVPGTVVYRVAFLSSPAATPDVVGTVGNCGQVEVTVNGRAAPIRNDEPKAALEYDLAHVLGLAEPHFG
jgi:hypothetical protein